MAATPEPSSDGTPRGETSPSSPFWRGQHFEQVHGQPQANPSSTGEARGCTQAELLDDIMVALRRARSSGPCPPRLAALLCQVAATARECSLQRHRQRQVDRALQIQEERLQQVVRMLSSQPALGGTPVAATPSWAPSCQGGQAEGCRQDFSQVRQHRDKLCFHARAPLPRESPGYEQADWCGAHPSAVSSSASVQSRVADERGPAFAPPGLELAPEELEAVLLEKMRARHHRRECKPCAFFYTKGCVNGARCEYCHFCPSGELKRRKAAKRMAYFARLQQAGAFGPGLGAAAYDRAGDGQVRGQWAARVH
mmetsp:Transcript_72434/g.193102  ORF Transcript_72434/g.193102 Transcript_72434/m.193102 type:complete len:311 (-) Transcript_72434:91-1023(-)